MSPPHPPSKTQEQSIKARKHQLFEADEPSTSRDNSPRRSFAQCLRETPAAPLSTTIKGALYATGILVAILLVAAFVTSGGGGRKKPKRVRPAASIHAPVILSLVDRPR